MPFLTTKKFDRAVRDSGRTLATAAFPYNLDPTQLSRSLNGHSFGPVIAARLENLGMDLGLDPSEILIEVEADR
jgi:hypothetical protein